jgi:hypothetical protein
LNVILLNNKFIFLTILVYKNISSSDRRILRKNKLYVKRKPGKAAARAVCFAEHSKTSSICNPVTRIWNLFLFYFFLHNS